MAASSRRDFLKTTIMAGFAATCFRPFDSLSSFEKQEQFSSRVALTTGDNRADLVFRALQPFSEQIRKAIRNRRVVLKPNNVLIDVPLTSTHVDTLEGVLEFLKSIGKLGNVIIAESAANGPTFDGFKNYGYYRLVSKYNVKLVDLDQEPFDILYVFDEKDFRPHEIKMSRVLLDPDSFIVSVARMKTHDRVVATLSLKNIVFGAPVKDIGYTWNAARKQGTKSGKAIAHGSGIRAVNYNLFALSDKLHPDFAIIDGFEGMEGNGPNSGTPVDHRVCLASPDWLAADRVAVELMGIDFAKVGYLNFCANAGKGVADLDRIQIIGEPVNKHVRSYRLNDNINSQLVWMNPPL